MTGKPLQNRFRVFFGAFPNPWGLLFLIGWTISLGVELGASSDSMAFKFSGLYQMFALILVLRKYFIYQRELQFLREFRHLSQTLDDLRSLAREKPYSHILEAVVRIAGFDRAIFFLLDDEGEKAVAEASFNFPEAVRSPLALEREDGPSAAWDVMDLNEPVVIDDTDDHPFLPLLSPALKALMGSNPFALIPIASSGITWGCLLVDRFLSKRPISDDDLLQLQVICDQISVTLQNHGLHQEILLKAQLLEDQGEKIRHELSLARIVQEGALPRSAPNWNGLSLASIIRPARFLGGDFLRYLDGCKRGKHLCHSPQCPGCPNHLPGILIGDVCGKGIPAALIMAVVNSLFGEKVMYFSDPCRILTEVNRSLKEYLGAESRFNSTAFLGFFHLEEHTFIYGNAGHDFPLFHCAKTGELTELGSTGTLLGIFRESPYGEKEIAVGSGDRILFYTDGLTECLEGGNNDLDGYEILKDLYRKNIASDAAGLIAILTARVDACGQAEQSDDITAAVVVAE